MPSVLGSLLDIATTASTEVLCLILEVITECIRVNSTCLPQYSEQIVDLILHILQKFKYVKVFKIHFFSQMLKFYWSEFYGQNFGQATVTIS